MDLILSIVIVVVISFYKINLKPASIVQTSSVDELGALTEVSVKEDNLIVGKNLMLRREPRAYHKILDEMGLS